VFGGLFVAALLLVGGLLAGNLFNLNVPFTEETKDYPPRLILNEVKDLSEFRAGEAEFELIIDKRPTSAGCRRSSLAIEFSSLPRELGSPKSTSADPPPPFRRKGSLNDHAVHCMIIQ
jgi:hypothetical protein